VVTTRTRIPFATGNLQAPSGLVRIQAYPYTDVGRVRDLNEDFLLTEPTGENDPRWGDVRGGQRLALLAYLGLARARGVDPGLGQDGEADADGAEDDGGAGGASGDTDPVDGSGARDADDEDRSPR